MIKVKSNLRIQSQRDKNMIINKKKEKKINLQYKHKKLMTS